MKNLILALLLFSQVHIHFAGDSSRTAALQQDLASCVVITTVPEQVECKPSVAAERQQFIENGWARKADGTLIESTFVLVRNSGDDDSTFSIVILGDDNSSRLAFLHDDSLLRDEAVSRIQTFRAFEFDTVYGKQ